MKLATMQTQVAMQRIKRTIVQLTMMIIKMHPCGIPRRQLLLLTQPLVGQRPQRQRSGQPAQLQMQWWAKRIWTSMMSLCQRLMTMVVAMAWVRAAGSLSAAQDLWCTLRNVAFKRPDWASAAQMSASSYAMRRSLCA